MDLEKILQAKGLNIKLKETLKGGTVSQVYAADLDGQPVVVKHTDDLQPFDPTEIFISKNGHKVDAKVLKLLQNSSVKVPKVIVYFPDIFITIMADVRTEGFTIFSDQILTKKFSLNSAAKIGEALAELGRLSKNWQKFKTNETAGQSIYERGLELRLMYPNAQIQYLELEKEFTQNNRYWLWPDGHPKNMFVNQSGEVIFIDFGRSIWADQRYLLPNFLAHIVIYSLAGYIKRDLAKQYLHDSISAYQKLEPVDESLFCRYLAMEVLHRAFGKWLQRIEIKEQKLALVKFGLTVFDDKIDSINKLTKLL